VPSGIWQQHEYDKLPNYDGEMGEQVMKGALAIFMCHQKDGHLCAGWVAAHKPENLLAFRMAKIRRENIDPAVWDYQTDIPVFSSGSEAKAHGTRDLDNPGPKAQRLMGKLMEKGCGQGEESDA
jgi:hypothetical protein